MHTPVQRNYAIAWCIGVDCKFNGGFGVAAFTLAELESMVVVNMGDYKTARGETKLMTKDLGSCVGVALRDPHTGVGGLLHVMLPNHTMTGRQDFVAAKYADSGLDEMIDTLVLEGAQRKRLVAKIAGAAHMFHCDEIPESRDISSRNLNAVIEKLDALGIPLLASDVGENFPRTVVFEPGSGSFRILTPGKEEKMI